MSGKSWYEYKFGENKDAYPNPVRRPGIYDIGKEHNSYDECLSFIVKCCIKYIENNNRFRRIILNTNGPTFSYLHEFAMAIGDEKSFSEAVKKNQNLDVDLLKYVRMDEHKEHLKEYIIKILLFLSNQEEHRSQLQTGDRLFFRKEFNKIWTFILNEYFQLENPRLFKLEQKIFRALKTQLKGIPNMSTFRTQVNPKDGCVASTENALQRSITPDMEIDFDELFKNKDFHTGYKDLVNKIMNFNEVYNPAEKETIEKEVKECSEFKQLPYARATGIAETTLSSATKIEVQLGCYKLINACGLISKHKQKRFISDFYNQCILSGLRPTSTNKLEDEHSLPFKILFGILKPDAFRVILTRMTHDLNHKFIPEEYKDQESGKPLAGKTICNASFTKRLVSQIDENDKYDEFTLYRFLFLFHAYWLANKFVLTTEEVKKRFTNLTSIKSLIDLAHTEFHRNISTGIVRPFKPRYANQFSVPQIQNGGTQRKTYKRKKKSKIKLNKTKRMLGGMVGEEGGEDINEDLHFDIDGILDEDLHFDIIDGNLDIRYSPEYFVFSISSIFEALEMLKALHNDNGVRKQVGNIYEGHIGSNFFESVKHDPHLKLVNAVIDLLDDHVDSYFMLYKKQVERYEEKSNDPYLKARKHLVDNIRKRQIVHEDTFSVNVQTELRDKIGKLIEICHERRQLRDLPQYKHSLSALSNTHDLNSIDDSDDATTLKELEALKTFVDTDDFIAFLNVFDRFVLENEEKEKEGEKTIVELFLDDLFKEQNSNNFNIVTYKVFKQNLDNMLYNNVTPEHVSASEVVKVHPLVVNPNELGYDENVKFKDNYDHTKVLLPHKAPLTLPPHEIPLPINNKNNENFNNSSIFRHVNVKSDVGVKQQLDAEFESNQTPEHNNPNNNMRQLAIPNKSRKRPPSQRNNSTSSSSAKIKLLLTPEFNFRNGSQKKPDMKPTRTPAKGVIGKKTKPQSRRPKPFSHYPDGKNRKFNPNGDKMNKIRTQTKRNKRKGAKKNKTTNFKST